MSRQRIYISGLISLTCTILIIVTGCGSSPGDPPILPPPVTWTGNLIVSAEVDTGSGDPVSPDSINVAIDGIELGWHSNPDTIMDVAEGSHRIKAYGYIGDEAYYSPSISVYVTYDEYSPVTASLTQTGIVHLVASADVTFDSIGVKLNGDTIVYSSADEYLEVPAGNHKFVIFADSDTTHLEGWLTDIDIAAAETTDVDISMVAVAPFVGVHAPDTDVTDIYGNTFSLSDHWGEVIYMYFFKSTWTVCVGEEIPSAQELIHDHFAASDVEVWMLNKDTGVDWLLDKKDELNLHLPIMQHADHAFDAFRLGREYRTLEPLYTVIDKNGIVRLRETNQGTVTLEDIQELIQDLLEE